MKIDHVTLLLRLTLEVRVGNLNAVKHWLAKIQLSRTSNLGPVKGYPI